VTERAHIDRETRLHVVVERKAKGKPGEVVARATRLGLSDLWSVATPHVGVTAEELHSLADGIARANAQESE
jgi:hypothetical protein